MSTAGSGELAHLLRAIRAGAVDPHHLAAAAAAWPDDGRPGFLAFLAARGGLAPTPDPAGGAAATPVTTPGHATASFDGNATPGHSTPSFDGDGTPTHDPFGTPDFFPASPAAPDDDPPVGGRYRLLRVHRDGGLGRVHVALDLALGREVALKTVRPDRRCGPLDRARFVHEARVTGRLEHPCVVPLYDLIDPAGGRPCYAMRFVTGRTLAEATAQYHKARGAGTATRLDFASLLDAFVAVCRAVAFAHSRGYLHRDLKGQNVVLGDFGEVFLIDWGLAAPVADTDPAGDVSGSPPFMAPEVAAGGPASTASDVYGLGAVLYVILAGRPPYDGPTPAEVLESVKAAPPPPPRAVNTAAPPGLDAVCRRAMSRDPAGRYASADALATDVRRWLADEPVTAFRDPVTVRAARWARRHRTAVAAAAVFLLTAVVGLAAATVLIAREEEATAGQRDRANDLARREAAERERAEREKDRAAANFRTASDLAFAISERLYHVETGGTARASDAARKRVLEGAGAAFDQLLAGVPDDAGLTRQAAYVHWFTANVCRTLGDTPAAEREYRAAVALWGRLADRSPGDPAPADHLGEARRDYALFLKRAGRLPEARAAADAAAATAAGLEHKLRDSSYRRSRGMAELARSEVAAAAGDFPAAEAAARAAAGLFGGLKGVPAAEATAADPLLPGLARDDLATALRERGRVAEALAEHDAAVAAFAALLGPKADRDARCQHCDARLGRAVTLDRAGRGAAAAAELAAVAADAAALVKDYPDVPFYKETLAAAHLRRGEVLTRLGRAGAARGELELALAVTKGLVTTRAQTVPEALRLRGLTYLRLAPLAAAAGTPADARAQLGNAVKVLGWAVERDPENVYGRRALAEAVALALRW